MADNSQKTGQPNSWYNLILHLHPRMVNPYTLSLKLTFGLDGICVDGFSLLEDQ